MGESRKVDVQRVDRLLARLYILPAERRVVGAVMTLYFGTWKEAARVRTLLIHNRVAVEQWERRVIVYTDAWEEKQTFSARNRAS